MMHLDKIDNRSVRRAVLVVVFFPVLMIAGILGALIEMRVCIADAREMWREL